MRSALRDLLIEPDSFFDRRADTLSGVEGFAVAAVVTVVLTALLAGALFGISQQLTGTTMVDNPDRPPEAFCEDDGVAMPSMNTSGVNVSEGCDQPAQVERNVGELFWQAASGQVLPIGIGIFVVWFGVGIALHVAAKLADGRGSFGETLAVTAYGMVPTLVAAAVGSVLLVWLAAEADLGAGDPERLVAQFRQFTSGASGLALTGVQLGGVAWQTYVWTYGLAHAHDLSTRGAGVAAGCVGAVMALITLV